MGEKVYGKKAHPIVISPERKPVKILGYTEEQVQAKYPNAQNLPKYYVYAMLDGPNTDGESCGALALVIFFTDDINQPFEELIQDKCKDEIWEYMAYNYDV